MLANEVKLGVMLGALNTNHPDIENIKKENSELSKKMDELEYGTGLIDYKKSNLFPVLFCFCLGSFRLVMIGSFIPVEPGV